MIETQNPSENLSASVEESTDNGKKTKGQRKWTQDEATEMLSFMQATIRLGRLIKVGIAFELLMYK